MMTADIQLVGVPASSVEQLWDEVKPMLEKGISHGDGELDINDILKFLLDRAMQLWVLYDYSGDTVVMAGVTEIVNYPKYKVCRAVILGGDSLDQWVKYIQGIEAWAVEMGCTKVEAYGRRGLAKKMESIGYSNRYVLIRKDL